MQGSHQTSDMLRVPNRLGWARAQARTAWRSLLNTGAWIPNGSDFPVEAVNPLISFHSFFTRQGSRQCFRRAGGCPNSARRVRKRCCRSRCGRPTRHSWRTRVVSVTAGKYADFVVLDRDIMAVAPKRCWARTCCLTVLGGKVGVPRYSN